MRDSGRILLLIHWGLVNSGLNLDRIYKSLGYDARNLPLKETRTRHDLQKYFWAVIEEVTGDPDIGLHLCHNLPVFRGEVLEYLFMSSPSFGQGLRTVLPYRRLISDALHIELIENDAGTYLEIQGTSHDAPQLRHPEICYAYTAVQVMHAVTDETVWPTHVRLCCPSPESAATVGEFEQLFGCPVEFDREYTEIWIEPDDLKRQSSHYDPSMLNLHRSYADREMGKLRQLDLIDDINAYLMGCFDNGNIPDEGDLTIAAAASALGMSPRRLRRALAEAGTSFRDLIRDNRFAYARRVLRHSGESLDVLADNCGFSMPSAFFRAFKEWAGCTPTQYREQYQPSQEKGQGSDKNLIRGDFNLPAKSATKTPAIRSGSSR